MSGGFGLPVLNLAGMIGGIGKAYDEGFTQAQQRKTLARLGEQIQGGDYSAAAQTAFQAGDPGTGIGLLKLGETARLDARKDAASRDFYNAIGGAFGGGDTGVPRRASDAGSTLPSFADTSSPSGDYTANLFKRESGSNDFAQAPTSSARGAGQFTRGTWNDLAAKQPGLGLTPVGNGQDGRTDRAQMVRATNALTAQNEGVLQGAGLPVTDASRYALHFLGAGGGRRLVAGAMRNPDAPATAYASPDQVAANRNVFYRRDGSPKSAGEVMADFGRSFGGGGGVQQARTSSPAPVAFADDEAGVQALEARMGMDPASASQQVASTDPRADMPVPDAQEAAFYVPDPASADGIPHGVSGGGQSMRVIPQQAAPGFPTRDTAPAGRVMAMPGDPSASAQVPPDAMIGNRAASSLTGSPLGQRIPALLKAMASPYIEGGQREVAGILLRQALDESKIPDSAKDYLYARAQGWTQARNPNEYALEKQRNPGADLSSQVQARAAEAQRFGLQPGTPEFRSYVLTGKEPTDRDEGAKITAQIEARRAQAPSLGLQEGTPSWRSYVATGKVGADRDMSAGDKKAIDTADNAVISAQASIGMLEQAKELSKQAYGGPFASERGKFMSTFGGERGQATQELDNLVTTNALTNLKSIFGGNPTEGERKILLDVAGSSSLPHELRVRVYQRAIDAAQLRMQQNQDRGDQIREGTYYRPRSGLGQDAGAGSRQLEARQDRGSSSGVVPPSAAADYLRANPALRGQFDAKYGAGSADRILGGR